MVFYFKNLNKDILMTDEDEEHYRINNICTFCEKIVKAVKFKILVN